MKLKHVAVCWNVMLGSASAFVNISLNHDIFFLVSRGAPILQHHHGTKLNYNTNSGHHRGTGSKLETERKRKRSSSSSSSSWNKNGDEIVLSANVSSFQELERLLKNYSHTLNYTKVLPDRFISTQIMTLFQKSRRKLHSDLMDELLSYKIQVSNSSGDDENSIYLMQFMTPRDQSDLIRLLGKSELYIYIIQFLNFLNGSKHDKIYSYTTAILVLASSKFKKRAIQLLDEMEEQQIIPNTYTYTAAFLALDNASNCLDLLSRARRQGRSSHNLMNVHLYNAAIHACSRDKKYGYNYAISIFRQMPRDNVRPNTQTFASLLHACAQSNKLKIALAIFDEMMHTPGIDMKQADKAWLAALEACVFAKNGSKAIEVLEKMLIMCGNAALPSTVHLNMVLSALAKEGQYETASSLLEHMHNGTLSHLFPSMEPEFDRNFVDLVSVNTVLSSFAKMKHFEGAKALFDRLKDGEFKSLDQNGEMIVLKPDIISYNTLLSSCDNPVDAKNIVLEIRLSRRNRYNPLRATHITYTNAMGVCKRVSDLNAALSFFEEAKSDGIQPNEFMYSSAIWTAASVKNANCARMLLDKMMREHLVPNAVCFDGVFSALASGGHFKDACHLYDLMIQNNISPTIMTFRALAKCAENSIEHLAVTEIINGLEGILRRSNVNVELSSAIYNILILMYGKVNDFENAIRTYKGSKSADPCSLASILYVSSTVSPARYEDAIILLHTSDIVPGARGRAMIDSKALGYAIIACAKENEWEEGLNLLELYSGSGGTRVTVDAINSLIACAGRSGRPDIAISLLNVMESKYSTKPNSRTYRSAIIACNQAEHQTRRQMIAASSEGNSSRVSEWGFQWWEAALSLLRRMKECGLYPDIQTFSSAISACEAAGQWQRAIGVLRQMNTDNVCTPNLYCFNAALAACEKGGAWLEAVELYERMESAGVTPNFISVNSLLIALEQACQMELAEHIYREAVKKRIIQPWKWTTCIEEGQSRRIRAMDLHFCSVAMAKIALRNVMYSLFTRSPLLDLSKQDLVLIVGKGNRSQNNVPILLPEVQKFVSQEYGLNIARDETNLGRLRIRREDLLQYCQE